jgi:hypothetical protein
VQSSHLCAHLSDLRYTMQSGHLRGHLRHTMQSSHLHHLLYLQYL